MRSFNSFRCRGKCRIPPTARDDPWPSDRFSLLKPPLLIKTPPSVCADPRRRGGFNKRRGVREGREERERGAKEAGEGQGKGAGGAWGEGKGEREGKEEEEGRKRGF